jgi:hypothetical protein
MPFKSISIVFVVSPPIVPSVCRLNSQLATIGQTTLSLFACVYSPMPASERRQPAGAGKRPSCYFTNASCASCRWKPQRLLPLLLQSHHLRRPPQPRLRQQRLLRHRQQLRRPRLRQPRLVANVAARFNEILWAGIGLRSASNEQVLSQV